LEVYPDRGSQRFGILRGVEECPSTDKARAALDRTQMSFGCSGFSKGILFMTTKNKASKQQEGYMYSDPGFLFFIL
jgi:hypothetical protein